MYWEICSCRLPKRGLQGMAVTFCSCGSRLLGPQPGALSAAGAAAQRSAPHGQPKRGAWQFEEHQGIVAASSACSASTAVLEAT